MTRFNKEDENPDVPTPSSAPASPRSPGGGRNTYIGPGVKIKGEISADTEIVVDGEVEGRLELKERLVVGPKGVIHGDIVARSVEVGGKVVGNVRSADRFELLKSGRIEGDVVSPRVVIAEGAFFKGNVEMSAQQAPSSPAPRPPVPDKTAPPSDRPAPGASTGTGPGTGDPK